MKEEQLLIRRLEQYAASGRYPFHMPGHKRLSFCEGGFGCEEQVRQGLRFPNPYLVDITEIDGFDNLHHPEGILKDSMEWAAKLYGADRTYYLVNGSTAGILAAVCGNTRYGGRILAARNCHKAVHHGIYLNGLKASWVYPQEIPGLGIQGGISPEDVEKELQAHPDTEAVLIVSPTYDGMGSDIEAIAKLVHRRGLPLIVDEAHGAHFRYGTGFPKSALEQGADYVIQSVHKTLPSLTQTALLHIKSNRPEGGAYGNSEAVEHYLQIVQSSSPSYVLMASIEAGIFQMERLKQEGAVEAYTDWLRQLRAELGEMKCLMLAGETLAGQSAVRAVDCSKLVISTRGTGIHGEELGRILRSRYGIEMEMCGADYATAISTVGDSREGLKRLKTALLEIDRELYRSRGCRDNRESGAAEEDSVREGGLPRAETALSIREALDRKKEKKRLLEAEGEISGEYVYIYPPGIPILAPGERIGGEILKLIRDYKKKELPLQGMKDHRAEWILTVTD